MTNEELTNRVVELDERVAGHREQIKTCFRELGDVRKMADSIHKLATTVELLAREMKDTSAKVDRLTTEVEEIKEKPARRWEGAVKTVLTVILTAAVTWALAQIGLK